MTPEQEMETIFKHLKETSTASSLYPELADELDYSLQMMARSSEILANAQEQEQLARAKVMKEQIEKDPHIGATMLRELTNALTAPQSKIVTLADRLNAVLTHRADVLRTQVSYIKADLERSRFQRT